MQVDGFLGGSANGYPDQLRNEMKSMRPVFLPYSFLCTVQGRPKNLKVQPNSTPIAMPQSKPIKEAVKEAQEFSF